MKSFLLVALSFITFACTQGDSQTLSPSRFEDKITKQPGTLLDIRTPEEFSTGHIEKAVNLNFYASNFDKQVADLDKSKPLYVYCQRGGRSKSAVAKLQKNGFKQVFELEGGIANWKEEGKKLESETILQPKEMTVEEYKKVIASQHLVLVDFSAVWCGPCKKLSPIVDKIGHERAKDIKVLNVDVDVNSSVAQYNSIEEIPTLAYYKDGKIILRMIGFHTEKEINETIDKLLKE